MAPKRNQSTGGTEPMAVTSLESYETWSHEQILAGLAPGDGEAITGTQAAWRSVVKTGIESLATFRHSIEKALTGNWEGESGEAAIGYVRQYCANADGFLQTAGRIAGDLGDTGSVIQETKTRVPDRLVIGSGTSGPNADREADALDDARMVMGTFFQPGVVDVDGRTPTLAGPDEPATPPGAGDVARSLSRDAATPSMRADAKPAAADVGESEAATTAAAFGGSTAGPGGLGSSTAGGGPGAGTGGASTTGAPDVRTSAVGTAGAAPGGIVGAVPGVVSSIPSAPRGAAATAVPRAGAMVVDRTPATAAMINGSTSNSANRPSTPMGGMYPPMHRGGRDDENSRSSSDFLVAASNTNSLIGELPPTTQPVIGR